MVTWNDVASASAAAYGATLTLDKSTAIRLIQKFGLERQPTYFFPNTLALGVFLESERRVGQLWVGRTSAQDAQILNLPRIVGLNAADVLNWATTIPHDLTIILQPFDPVLSSAEIAFDHERVFVEIVPGIWEMDNVSVPTTIHGAIRASSWSWRINGSTSPGVARFCLPQNQSRHSHSVVSDNDRSAYISWAENNWARLQRLRASIDCRFVGLKAHRSSRYGISAQNLRDVDSIPSPRKPAGDVVLARGTLPVIGGIGPIDGPLPKVVKLTFSVAREDAKSVAEFAVRLRQAGVEGVVIESGILSHLAITIREAGIATLREGS